MSWRWMQLLGGVGAAQVAVQGLGFASGILLVRILDKQQYAYYTLAYAMMGTMNILSDGGISAGVMAEGGKVWNDFSKLGAVLATGLALRRQFALVSCIISTPIMIYLLMNHGAGISEAVALTLVTLAAMWFGLVSSIWNIAPALHQQIAVTQKIGLAQNLFRVVGLALFIPFFSSAVVAVGIAAVAQGWASRRLRGLSAGLAAANALPDHEARQAVVRSVGRIMPAAVYFCVSGQISVWVISFMGTSSALAGVGALGRVTQLFTMISVIVGIVIIPRFARLSAARPSLLLKRYFQVLLLLTVVSCVAIGASVCFPGSILWVLGKSYMSLRSELGLQVVAGALSFLAGTAYFLGVAQHCIISPFVGIPIEFTVQVVCLALLPVHTIAGVLWLQIFVGASSLLLHCTNFLYMNRKQYRRIFLSK
jgi:hypothetical protein